MTHFALNTQFKASQRPMNRAGFRYNAPKAVVARLGWFATLLAALGL